ncbi:pilin [Neisseria weaveri]|uniref:pilin n=1 Tax=Neisseria weaveri TaxID=28091 RepID=UPI000223293B|nr:pilin [Neisseria weaveri]EGV37979.1 hypothetical protein l13_02290 [Neisseria weaveri ATCC 51223]
MKALQKGFTLIELMIVIAIIGILAVIALPAYQDYTARAQVSEAFSLMEGQKSAVTEFYADKGAWPKGNSDAGVAAETAISGKYVAQVKVTENFITATFKSSGVNDDIKGTSVAIQADASGGGSFKWTCVKPAENTPAKKAAVDKQTTVMSKFLPSVCRDSTT